MRHTNYYATVCWAVLALLPNFTATSAAAPLCQAPADAPATDKEKVLSEELAQLKQQARELQAELDAARERIKELEARLAQMERLAAGSPPPAPTEMLPDPALGPGGLLTKLRNDFATTFQDKEFPATGPGADAPSQAAWAAFLRTAEPWVVRNERGAMEVRWTGSIDPASVKQTGREVTMNIVFTNGGRDYPATVTVDQGMVARLRTPDGSLTADPVLVNAIVTPKLRINPARREAGAFERPPLVGPFVEFGFEVKPKVILTPERAKQLQPPAPTP